MDRGRFSGSSAQADAQVAFSEVDLAEIVCTHQPDQILDGPHIKWTGNIRSLVGHFRTFYDGELPDRSGRKHFLDRKLRPA